MAITINSDPDYVPVNRPLLPDVAALAPYLRSIDAARQYSNHGPLFDSLRNRLAGYFNVEESRLTLAGSGTSALIGAILATAGRATAARPLCICPSYTFVATAVAASACGFTPYLVDIDPKSWASEPKRLLRLPQLASAGVVMAVAPYGRMVDMAAWQGFAAQSGIPLVIDAAACFDTLDSAAICAGKVPVCVSLHATKTFSTAEGGLILCGDSRTIDDCARALNFGFFTGRESVGPSINGKLSEYHAAVGLAELDGWKPKRAGFIRVAQNYLEAAKTAGLAGRVIADSERANPYVVYLARSAEEAETVRARLTGRGIDTRLWYGLGLHRQPNYAECPSEDLPATNEIAPCIVGLPVAVDLPDTQIRRIIAAIAG